MAGWVRVETRFINHPKVLDIGPIGEALWLRGLCYAGEQLTDGFVPETFIRRMADMKGIATADRLVAAGLWDRTEGGYQIHDYLDWQRSRDEVDDIANKRAEAGRKGGKQKSSNLLANAKQNASNLPDSAASKSQAYTDTDTDTDTDTEKRQKKELSLSSDDEDGATPKPVPMYSAEFETFWKAYPSGHGAKKVAYGQWRRLSPDERARLPAALEAWKASERWREGYVKSAELWIRDRLWDQPPPPPRPRNGELAHRGPKGPDFASRVRELEAQERALQ